MTRLTFRSLASRKLRTALTAMAIVLGVAMISGTYVLTDTINRSFASIFTKANEGVDVAVTPHQAVDNADSPQEVPLDGRLLDKVRSTPGVADAAGDIFSPVTIEGKNGKPIKTGGAPTFAASVNPPRFEAFTAQQGRLPRADDEVALDKRTVDDQGFKLGDTITVAGDPGARRYTLVGVAKFGDVSSLAGAPVALLTLRQAQELTDKVGRFDQVSAAAGAGISPPQLRDRVRAALRGERVDVRTGKENAAQDTKDIQDSFGFLKTALLVFAGIALFVGAFVIYNTFNITVAQRTRELALLRTMGASRRQVLRSVVLEAALVGIAASLVGLAAGLLVAPGIVGLFKAVGLDLPTTGTVFKLRTVIVALIVGGGVTVVSSLAPALRATRVPPMAAMREEVGAARRSGRGRIAFSLVLAIAGAVAMGAGLFGGSGGSAAALVGLGAAAVFLAVALFSPQLVRPLARAVGAPIEAVGGLPGRLARENATRAPGRTAATAAALMIGVALITFVSIFAAGIRASVNDVVDRSFAGDLTVRNQDGFSPLPRGTAAGIERGLGSDVQSVTGVRFASSLVRGVKGTTVTVGVDPASMATGYKVKWDQGNDALLRGLQPDQVIVDKNWADGKHVDVGETLQVTTAKGEHVPLKVVGTLDEGGTSLIGGGILVSNAALARDWDLRNDAFVFLNWRPGVDPVAARRKLDALLARQFPIAESQNRQEVKDAQAGQVNQILGLFYALLGLSIIVSLFGIVNTLALSIFERTRELGMLRAIGTSRRQVRRTVRYESAITAMIGAVLGIVLGTVFAFAVTQPLADEGFAFSLPVGTLAGLLVLAALAGVLAAIGPARRASRIDVLRALAYE